MSPNLLMLVGLVGSGKTTFSKALCSFNPNWLRVSQDELGSRRACESAAKAALLAGHDVVIDRCNFDKNQREPWLRIAHNCNAKVYCLELKTDLKLCRSRILAREDHPTQVQGHFGTTVLDRQEGQYKPLTSSEKDALEKTYVLKITDNSVSWTESLVNAVLGRLGINR